MSELLTITAFSRNENIDRVYFRKIVNYNNLIAVRVTNKGYKHYNSIELKDLLESYKSCKTLNQLVNILKQGKNTIKLAIDIHEVKPFYVSENEIKYYFPSEVKDALELLDNYKSLTEMSSTQLEWEAEFNEEKKNEQKSERKSKVATIIEKELQDQEKVPDVIKTLDIYDVILAGVVNNER